MANLHRLFRSVYPFTQGTAVWRHARPRCSICSNRPRVAATRVTKSELFLFSVLVRADSSDVKPSAVEISSVSEAGTYQFSGRASHRQYLPITTCIGRQQVLVTIATPRHRHPQSADVLRCIAGPVEINFYHFAWQWRNFVRYLCHLVFDAMLWVKLLEMVVTLLSLHGFPGLFTVTSSISVLVFLFYTF